MFALNISQIVQAILFGLFSLLTSVIAAVIGPTYDNLLVPELQPSALFPPLLGATAGQPAYFSRAVEFSTFLLANVVDPAVALVAVGVGIAYLSKAIFPRGAAFVDSLLVRLIIAVVAANFTIPIAAGLLGLAGAMYPTIAGWDGGAWEQWTNLAGVGELQFSWDNGALAFVLSFVLFTLVLLLVLAVGIRDALLAVLLVLLPLFTLVWPIPTLAPLARRAWLLFGELAFLPCVLVVPLELAVGAPNVVLLVAFLGAALASPYFLSLAGSHLTAFGFPSVGASVSSATQRGLALAPGAVGGYARPALDSASGASAGLRAAAGAVRTGSRAPLPGAAPLALGELVGRGAEHLVRHLRSTGAGPTLPPVQREE